MRKKDIRTIHEFTAAVNEEFRTSYEEDDLLTLCDDEPRAYWFETAWNMFHTTEFVTWLAIQCDDVYVGYNGTFEYWFADFTLYVEMDMMVGDMGV